MNSYELLFRQNKERLVRISEAGVVTDLSDSAARLFKAPREDMLGHPITDFIDWSESEKVLARAAGFSGWTPSACSMSRTGEHLDVKVISIRSDDVGLSYFLSFAEVSSERHAFRQLREDVLTIERYAGAERSLRDELEAANARLTSFAYRAAHDLKAPMRHIRQCLMLMKSDPSTEDQEELHEIIYESASQAHTLISDLLAYSESRRAIVETSETDLGELVRYVTHSFEMDLKDGEAITIAPLPKVMCDRTLIQRVLENLIGNSVKYKSPDRPLSIHISSETSADRMAVLIADNGIGIDPSRAEQMFQPFERLHSGYEGSGIGLALCQELIAAHGWTITASGAVEEGLTIRIDIPATHVVQSESVAD